MNWPDHGRQLGVHAGLCACIRFDPLGTAGTGAQRRQEQLEQTRHQMTQLLAQLDDHPTEGENR